MDKFFVQIKNVSGTRVTLLESSKLVLHSMKIENKINLIRKEKSELINNLREDIKEISFLLTRLKEHLPHSELLEEAKKEKEKETKKPSKKKTTTKKTPAKTKAVPKKPKKEFDASDDNDISAALASIEKKLNQIN